ncbi:MAG: sporulation protein YqfC [Hyphomonadaceae bacterium]|nr:sporulation protein YqfC [Clostridia bacterium]
MRHKVKEKVVDLLELPEDIVLDLPKIEMIGNHQLRVENYKGIIEYSDEIVRLNAHQNMITIRGTALVIRTMTVDEIILSGEISTVEFCR